MFTGIIEEIGQVQELRRGASSSVLTIAGSIVLEDLRVGDSVAVNGVCLTAASRGGGAFTADVMHETLRRSSLGSLQRGSRVNLERALPVSGRFGGHIVTGHIDGTGIIADIRRDDNAIWFFIRAEDRVMRYIVEKGSIAMDGISLTVAEVTAEGFRVSVIPHTAGSTTLAEKAMGAVVNLENDVLAKYVERLLGKADKRGITTEFLERYGY